jgi:aspartate kinase
VSEQDPASTNSLVVLKFGDSAVVDAHRLKDVARCLVGEHERGRKVVGVLAAIGHTTDDLLALAHAVSPQPQPRELDMLVSVGERVACALCAMAIIDLGHSAVSLTGSQAGIVTDTAHGDAHIVDVRARRIEQALDAGSIVLVAGFQGVSTEHEVTTLGPCGSDITAIALASALGAAACEIVTDAAAVEELPLRSVEFARDVGVTLRLRSPSQLGGGSLVAA